MTTMRAQLAPALLLLLILLAAAVPLVPALTPEEIRDRKINGANKLYIMSADPAAYAGEKKSTPDSKKEAPKDVVQKTSYVMGAGAEPKPESKKDEKVLEAKISAEVKEMRKEAAYDDAVAEKNAKEFKSKPKNTTDDAEDQAKEKKSKSKGESFEDEALKKESKSKADYSVDADGEKKEKKSKSKDDDSEEKKSKSKSEDSSDDEKKEKKSKSKNDDDYTGESEKKKIKSKDDDDEKKEKKSKSKEEDDSEKKSKFKTEAYEFPGAEKKSKEKSESSEDKKKPKSKNKEEDFDAVPMESKADESVTAADTPDGYQAPTTKTMSAADTPDGYLAPKKAEPKMSAADTPDGYAAPTTMSAADTPDGYVTPSKAKPAMSAADTPDGYLPATDSPDGNVPASDSPDGYAAPSTKSKVNVQSFSEMVPQSVLQTLSPKVKSLCGKTNFPYTCETSIARLPETTVVPARQKDSLGVLTLAVDAVRAKIAEAKNAVKDITSDPRTDKISKSALSDCLQMYDDINSSYDTALTALKRGDKGSATSAIDAARTYVETCDQGFLDRPGLKPVIADLEKVLAQLSSNVIAIQKYM